VLFLIRFCDRHLQESFGVRLERVHDHVRLLVAPYFIRARAIRTQIGLTVLGNTREIGDSGVVAVSFHKGHGRRSVEFHQVLVLSAYLAAQIHALVQEYDIRYDVRGQKQFHLAQIYYYRIREFRTCNAEK